MKGVANFGYSDIADVARRVSVDVTPTYGITRRVLVGVRRCDAVGRVSVDVRHCDAAGRLSVNVGGSCR